MKRFSLSIILALIFTAPVHATGINEVDFFALTGSEVIDFEEVPLGTIPGFGAPGSNFDDIFSLGGASFAERFVGQLLSFTGDADILSGLPTGPLALQKGTPNQNIAIVDDPVEAGGQLIAGLGSQGYPALNAIGEGSLAILFDRDQSEFGFQSFGGDLGAATFNFFQRDGSLLDTLTPTSLGDDFFGFSREGGIQDIAGISIHNTDLAGIAFDSFRFDVPGDSMPMIPGDPSGDPNPPAPVPEPSTFLLLGTGLATFIAWRQTSRRKQQE